MEREQLLEEFYRNVVQGQEKSVAEAAGEWLKMGFNPLEAVEEGLSPGIREVGRLYDAGEYFLPELVGSAEAMKAALRVLRPAIAQGSGKIDKGLVIMATVEGDIHEIGKSVVAAVLEARGYQVIDLGSDCKLDNLYKKTMELNPDVVGLSALLTTTMTNQRRAIAGLRERGLKTKVIVGGAPVNRRWAEEIGADGFGKDAFEAAELVDKLMR
ncbi:cobalamin-dependent protein [bacterium]|nr:cobalamin-dependent protein [bacterium]